MEYDIDVKAFENDAYYNHSAKAKVTIFKNSLECITIIFPEKEKYYSNDDWYLLYDKNIIKEKYNNIFEGLLKKDTINFYYDLSFCGNDDDLLNKILNDLINCSFENVKIDGESIIGMNTILNNIDISNSEIEKSTIINDEQMELNNSKIIDSNKIKNLSGYGFDINSNKKIENVNSKSEGNEKSIIIDSELNNIDISNSEIEKSKIVNFIVENNSKIENVIYLNSKNNKSVIIETNIFGLQNYQEINGEILLMNSELSSEKLIFQNNLDEKIIIENSKIEGDASIFGNSEIRNGFISGNAVLFDESKVNGIDKNELKISGYSKIFGKAIIKDSPKISGFVNIYGESEVHDSVKIYGSVNILDDARISGNAKLYNKEIINKYEERFE